MSRVQRLLTTRLGLRWVSKLYASRRVGFQEAYKLYSDARNAFNLTRFVRSSGHVASEPYKLPPLDHHKNRQAMLWA
jgi:hypothetical protein